MKKNVFIKREFLNVIAVISVVFIVLFSIKLYGKAHQDRAKIIKEKMEVLASQLGLTTDQKDQIKEIFLKQAGKMKGLKNDGTSKHEIIAEMMSSRSSIAISIRSVLTEEQVQKFDELKKYQFEDMNHYKALRHDFIQILKEKRGAFDNHLTDEEK